MNIKALSPEYVGQLVSCKISGRVIKEGRIQFWNGNYYICQNSCDGGPCYDKLGYKYSWNVETGSGISLFNQGVSNLRHLSEWDTEEN